VAAVRPPERHLHTNDTIYVADSESGGRDTGAHELPGIRKGIRIGSAKTGAVTAFIEDMEPLAVEHAGAEGVGVDAEGHVYGGVVRRQMLERHEPIRTITPGVLKVAVTTDAPTNPFDSSSGSAATSSGSRRSTACASSGASCRSTDPGSWPGGTPWTSWPRTSPVFLTA
jgi:hypothetical protein